MDEKQDVIYFIQVGDDGPIKIGKTNKIAQRFEALQTGSPYKLRILGIMPGSYEAEESLHERFRSARVRGEWFSPVDELLVFIETNASPAPGRIGQRRFAVPIEPPVASARAWTTGRRGPRRGPQFSKADVASIRLELMRKLEEAGVNRTAIGQVFRLCGDHVRRLLGQPKPRPEAA